jgi:hypothetical protein
MISTTIAGAMAAPKRLALCAAINGNQFLAAYGTVCPSIVLTHNFNGDDDSDLMRRGTGGSTAMWLLNGGQVLQSGSLGTVPTTWGIVGQRQRDFNGDGKADLLRRDNSGNLAMWLMNGLTESSGVGPGNVPTTWSIYGTGDCNGDGKSDILWIDTSGDVALWFMNGSTISSTAGLGNVGTTWTVQSLNAE